MVILYFLLGVNLRVINSNHHLSSNIVYESGSYCTMVGRIKDPLQEKTKSYKSVFVVHAVRQDNGWKRKTGKLLVYFEKSRTDRLPLSGELIIIRSKINAVASPANPGQFNYAKYLSRQQISQQLYIPTGSWMSLGDRLKGIRVLASDLRGKTIQLLRDNASGENEFAVAAAILLGNKGWLDRDTLKDFSDAGAMHILCVSGMHVGIIYIVVNTLLAFLNRSKKTRWLKTVLIILSIWFYAMITGLSSPVLRASIMFSFMTIGRSFQRFTNIYNTLTASAMLLLIMNPRLLLDAGFQLSYIAVIGIVTLQPRIQSWWSPRYGLLKWIWSLVTVTLAAQLSILSISLFYFHKFPVYFIGTNLIVIPLVTLILYSGILFLSFSSVSFMSGILSAILFKLVNLLNRSVQFIEELPYSAIDGISVNGFETILLYGLLISVVAYLILKKKPLLFCFLVLLLIFSVEHLVKRTGQIQNRQIIVYQVRGHSVFDFISGRSNCFFADSTFYEDPVKMDFNVTGNWIRNGLQKHTCLVESQKETVRTNNCNFFGDDLQFIQYYDVRIVILNGSIDRDLINIDPLKIDLLIISGKSIKPNNDILGIFETDMVILDASNSWRQVRDWRNVLNEQGIPYHSVPDQGAFILDL